MPSCKYTLSADSAVYDKMFDHSRFLAQVSVSAAQRLHVELEKSFDFLKDSPESCPIYVPQNPVDAELRYKLFGKRYRIVFEIIGDAVYVYDIQDCRQDADKNLV